MTNSLNEAYRHCERISWDSGSSFVLSFRLLPRKKRLAMCALYAFSRLSDDLADSEDSADSRRAKLEDWRSDLADAMQGKCRSPLWLALHDTVRRFAIPEEYLFAIVDGVAMDLAPPRYETFAELKGYCYHVASAVGLACIHIFGFDDPRAKQLAETCGIAFQLTNILRDLAEDARHDRVYLPREEMTQFACQPEDFQQAAITPHVRDLVRFQVARAEQLYAEAAPLASLLHLRSRRTFSLMFSTYRTLLAEIKRHDGDVFSRRIRLGYRGKLKAVASAILFHPPKLDSTLPETSSPPDTRPTRTRIHAMIRHQEAER